MNNLKLFILLFFIFLNQSNAASLDKVRHSQSWQITKKVILLNQEFANQDSKIQELAKQDPSKQINQVQEYSVSDFSAQNISVSDFTLGYFLECRGDALEVCLELCQDKYCLINEDSCDGCISSNNYNLYTVYFDFKNVYSVDKQETPVKSLFNDFYNKELFVIDSTSIFGLLIDVSDSSQLNRVKSDFLNSCPVGSDHSFLVLSKNETNFMKLEYLICQGSYGQLIFQSDYSQEYQND